MFIVAQQIADHTVFPRLTYKSYVQVDFMSLGNIKVYFFPKIRIRKSAQKCVTGPIVVKTDLYLTSDKNQTFLTEQILKIKFRSVF